MVSLTNWWYALVADKYFEKVWVNICLQVSKKPSKLNYSTRKTKTDLLSKKKVVLESTSFKKFYNHNILGITSSYIFFKKSIGITSVKVFSILPLTLQRAIERYAEGVCS